MKDYIVIGLGKEQNVLKIVTARNAEAALSLIQNEMPEEADFIVLTYLEYRGWKAIVDDFAQDGLDIEAFTNECFGCKDGWKVACILDNAGKILEEFEPLLPAV